MFKRGWLNKGRIRSDEGFEVTFIGRSEILYQAGPRTAKVSGELLGDGFALEPETLTVWNDGTPVDEIQKQEIITKTFRALQSQGMTLDITPGNGR